MRKLFISLVVLSVALGVAHAAEAVLDMDLMQTVEDTNKSLASGIALRDGSGAGRDAAELHELFRTVEAHYQSRPDAADGLELARKSLALTRKIQEQVGARDFDGAQDSATELSRTCRACHTFYKKS